MIINMLLRMLSNLKPLRNRIFAFKLVKDIPTSYSLCFRAHVVGLSYTFAGSAPLQVFSIQTPYEAVKPYQQTLCNLNYPAHQMRGMVNA